MHIKVGRHLVSFQKKKKWFPMIHPRECPLEQEQGHQNYSYHRTGIPVTLIGVLLLNVCDSWHFTVKKGV